MDRSPRPFLRAPLALLLATAAVAWGAAACGGEATAGRPVTYRVALEAAAAPGEDSALGFTTDTGWRVALSEAQLVLAPLYVFEKRSPLLGASAARGPPRHWLHALGDWVLPAAHAHEGDLFLAGGRVMGEWDEQVLFTLGAAGAAGRRELGLSPGIAGPARSFSVLLQPPARRLGAEAAALEGASLRVRGVASRGGQRVAFRARVAFPPPQELQRVDLVPTELVLEEGGTLVLSVHPHAWFTGARFEAVAPPEDVEVELREESQPHRALRVNARRHTAYSARFEP
jgi:hypothetical protein